MGAKGEGRPHGCAPCCQVHTNKTRVKPDIPTKSYTCMSKSWLLGNVYTAKSCKGEKRVPDALNRDGSAKGDNPDRKYRSSRIAGGWARG